MDTIIRGFSLLTAGFPHGAYQSLGANQPELRPPSVKGQLRWWYDALFEDKASEDVIFGGLKNPMPGGKPDSESSRVIVRVEELASVQTSRAQFMPHKGQSGGEKNAILPNTHYQTSLIPRRNGFTSEQREKLERVVDAWLLLGGIGQRASRAAGSLSSTQAPVTIEDYEARARSLLKGTKLSAAVMSKVYQNEQSLRRDAGDFLASEAFFSEHDKSYLDHLRGERKFREADNFLSQKLNVIPFGSARPRKPSALKLRAAFLDGHLRMVALWDYRHHSHEALRHGIEVLRNHPKEIGELLHEILSKLCPQK